MMASAPSSQQQLLLRALVEETLLTPPKAFAGEVALVPDENDGTDGSSGGSAYDLAVAGCRANNNCSPQRPAAVLVPSCVEDVRAAVLCAAERERRGLWSSDEKEDEHSAPSPPSSPPIAICAGGHSELCVADGAIVLHMKRMATVEVDAARRTITLGGGATFGEAVEAGLAHGLVMPTGTAPSVGVGAVLCGGVGKLTRGFGLACDNLLEADVVLADGTLKTVTTASEGNGEQLLLWALRGCGCQFGVVTRLVVRLFEVEAGRHFCGRRCLMQAPVAAVEEKETEEAIGVLMRAEAAARGLPPSQSVDIVLGVAPPAQGEAPALMACTMPCALAGPNLDAQFADAAADALFFSCPPYDRASAVAAAATTTTNPSTTTSVVGYWPIPFEPLTAPPPPAAEPTSSASPDGNLQASGAVLSYVRQIYVDEIGAQGWRRLVEHALACPSPIGSIVSQHGGGCARRPPDGVAKSCIGARTWEYSVLFMALWEDEAARAANEAWADAGWQMLLDTGLATGTYVVDVNPFRRPGSADAEVALAYGEDNLRKLRELKRTLDPTNLFRAGWPLLPSRGRAATSAENAEASTKRKCVCQ